MSIPLEGKGGGESDFVGYVPLSELLERRPRLSILLGENGKEDSDFIGNPPVGFSEALENMPKPSMPLEGNAGGGGGECLC